MQIRLLAAALAAACSLPAQGDFATVLSRPASRVIDLPAEVQPFLTVQVKARVAGYVERVLVDRGSLVKRGQTLAQLSAPEMKSRILEAEAQVATAESERLQALAQLAATRSTADRLKTASATPGAISGNELTLAERQVEVSQAAVEARDHAKQVAQSVARIQKEMESYLNIIAPFDGIVTERFLHPGALVSPADSTALMTIEQVSRLRLTVPVPEQAIGGTATGTKVTFKVPAYPERTYTGTLARSSHTVDQKTRTMAVELDVSNRDGSLSPGMYPTVKWPVRGSHPALFVPKSSVVTTTERTFVIRDRNGRAEWVDVRKGAPDGDLVEVTGSLQSGDRLIRKATDELRDGSPFRR